MADEVQTPIQAPSFVPTTDVPQTGADALAELQIALETFPSQIDLVVTADPQIPVGKSYTFDWQQRRFVSASRQRGPKPTYGMETLKGWIEKCLNTARGAHPVSPRGYGLYASSSILIGNSAGRVPPDLEDRIKEALLFNPKITDVTDFNYSYDPDGEELNVDFRLVLSDGNLLGLQGLRVNAAF